MKKIIFCMISMLLLASAAEAIDVTYRVGSSRYTDCRRGYYNRYPSYSGFSYSSGDFSISYYSPRTVCRSSCRCFRCRPVHYQRSYRVIDRPVYYPAHTTKRSSSYGSRSRRDKCKTYPAYTYTVRRSH